MKLMLTKKQLIDEYNSLLDELKQHDKNCDCGDTCIDIIGNEFIDTCNYYNGLIDEMHEIYTVLQETYSWDPN